MTDPLQSRIEEFNNRFTPDWWMGFGTTEDINKGGISSIRDFITETYNLAKEDGIQEGREAERKDILKLVKEYDWDELGSDGHTILVRKNGIVGLITSRSNIGKV